ncbi:MAG: leucine-rich repeat protein [Clostridia bacterium]|nr:leucine-rich repeat protein [Clostridia bacterium]
MKSKCLKILSLLIIVLLPVFLFTACGNTDSSKSSERLSFELSSDMQTYSVTGIGDCVDKNIIFPATHNKLPVVKIKENAFKNNTGIESISIPDSISIIGKGAFTNCKNLKTISLEGIKKYNECFDGCAAIESVKIQSLEDWYSSEFSSEKGNPISNGATLFEKDNEIIQLSTNSSKIGSYAFYNYKLTELKFLADSVTIGDAAFSNNTSLTSIEFLGNSITIGNASFSGDTSLKNVFFNGKITADSCFADCVNIEKVNITDIKSWMQSTFLYQTSNPVYYSKKLYCNGNEVKEINVDTNSLSGNLFINCESIETVNFLTNINSIGSDAFLGCSSISRININQLDNWLNVNLGNLYANPACYTSNIYVDNIIITELTIPDGKLRLSNYQFFNWKSLEKVYVPNSVIEIGIGALGGCNAITEITLPFVGEFASNYSYWSYDTMVKCQRLGFVFGDITCVDCYHQTGYSPSYYVSWSYYIPTSLKTVYLPSENTTDEYLYRYFENDTSDKENYVKYIKK